MLPGLQGPATKRPDFVVRRGVNVLSFSVAPPRSVRVVWVGGLGGLLMYLASGIISNKLLDPDSYIETLRQADAYNRIYSEVLVDPALQDDLRESFGDLEVDPEDMAALLRSLAPPDYLRSQTESVIRSTVGYFGGDLKELAVYVDLGPPLANMEDVLLGYVDQRIDSVPVGAIPGDICSPDGASRGEEQFLAVVREMSLGNLPRSLPSWESAEPACRKLLFDRAVIPVLTSPTLAAETRSALEGQPRGIEGRILGWKHPRFLQAGSAGRNPPTPGTRLTGK